MIKPNDYFEKNLKNILQPLFLSILSNKPNDIVLYSIDWLCKKGNYTKEGLTLEQKEEFTKLKQNNNIINIYESSNDDDEENTNNNEIKLYPKNIHRKGICGEMNKTIKTLKIYYKPEKQRNFIKASLLYSFLFSSLDLNDLNIIIDAMDEIIYYKNENIILEGDFGNCINYIPLVPFDARRFSFSVDSDTFLVVLGIVNNDKIGYSFMPRKTMNCGDSDIEAPNIDINLNTYASKVVKTLKYCESKNMGQWDKESVQEDYEEENEARKKVAEEANKNTSYNTNQKIIREKNNNNTFDLNKMMEDFERNQMNN
jgi:hypothetical protein